MSRINQREETASLQDVKGPTVDLGWREFRLPGGKGPDKIWRIKVEPDGEGFRTQDETVGKPVRESKVKRFKDVGREGSPYFVSARTACEQEVYRRIELRLARNNIEYIDGVAVPRDKYVVNFDHLIPKIIRTPKPIWSIADEKFRALHAAGETRITRKYDGIGLTMVRHSHGWEMYSLQGNVLTPFFPTHRGVLDQLPFGVGTILKGEGVLFRSPSDYKEDFHFMTATVKVTRKHEVVRAAIERGEIPEPKIMVYDILYRDRLPLTDVTYLERRAMWAPHFGSAASKDGLVLGVDILDEVTPDNWRTLLQERNLEGFVMAVGSSVLGSDILTFADDHPRPKGMYKLLPVPNEDVVVYAVRQVEGEIQSVFIKQRYPFFYPDSDRAHPRGGEWFACGRVSLHRSPELAKMLRGYIGMGLVKVVSNNAAGEKLPVSNDTGVVTVIEFKERTKVDKFRESKFQQPYRFRHSGPDKKAPSDCIAQTLLIPTENGDYTEGDT